MPFPLAHPAAILPLRRLCPRYLSFPALVMGSMVPDAGYFSGRLRLEELSHSFVGSFAFALPVGVVALLLTYGGRAFALRRFVPASPLTLLLRDWPALGNPAVVLLSLLLGAWTHLFLDSFTHRSGWLVQHVPFLQLSLMSVAGRSVRVCSILWYACSFAGIALVFVAFWNWQRTLSAGSPAALPHRANWTAALLVAGAVLPIEVVHHLVRNWVGMLLVALMTLSLLLLVCWRTTRGGTKAALGTSASPP